MRSIAVVLLCLVATAFAAPNSVRLWSRKQDRIVGGTETTITEYPWQLALIFEDSLRCGASIISADWALTAAHCVDGLVPELISLRAGSTNRDSGGTVLNVSQIIVNKWYYSPAVDYDMAVLQPSEPFALSEDVQPMGLPEAGYDPPGGLAVTVTGWGRIATGGSSPTVLLKVDTNIIDRATCQEIFSTGIVTKRMVCAGEKDKSTCNGDSGGPLVSGATQVGIVSWGSRPCQDYPSVFTNVGELRSWITDITGV